MNGALDTLVDARVVAAQKSSYALTKYGAEGGSAESIMKGDRQIVKGWWCIHIR
jgi:hypothetical protein